MKEKHYPALCDIGCKECTPVYISPQPEDMSQNNEKTNISGEHLVGSDILEEWESRFEQLFEENTIIDYDHPVNGLKCERETRYVFINFIRDEIRKAEERMGRELSEKRHQHFVDLNVKIAIDKTGLFTIENAQASLAVLNMFNDLLIEDLEALNK
jgi:hypothetical protein